MTYRETCEYLFTRTPLFSKTGASAYKPGLDTTLALDAHLGHPHRSFRSIHIGGTNGKGSTSHTLAAILQSAGYRVGLFTSPHLKDFRERIRVNGEMCSEAFVIDFVEKHKSFFEPLHPSFFEVTTAMAFTYFAEKKIDIAVVEVGLGGRLDCTNIITPDLSIVTNISLDHTDLLGNTLQEIAREKAGIIKNGIPFVLGEALPETLPVFREEAQRKDAKLILAEEYKGTLPASTIGGDCQSQNMRTILTAVMALNENPHYNISMECVTHGIKNVATLTGLHGRWETLSTSPLTICDVGHNPGAWKYLSSQLNSLAAEHQLHIVFGMCADKEVDTVMAMLPKSARYYWTQADNHRAIPATTLAEKGTALHLEGVAYPTVREAYTAAQRNAHQEETIFIGGSFYIVSEIYSH